jgi:hypothetical protein
MQPGDWYYLPQTGSLTPLYLPTAKQIPEDSDLRAIGFSFLNLTPLQTAYQNIQVTPAFNAWALVGIDSLAGVFGFQVQIWHLTRSGQRQLFNTSLVSPNIVGTAADPLFLPETELFLAGDSIRVQVKNLSTTQNDNIWLALWGGDVQV